MREIILIKDYRNHFYSSSKSKEASMDIERIKYFFLKNNYKVCVLNFYDIDFVKDNYSGRYILYQSSEDKNLHYKNYIEDILVGLLLQGAILIPDFYKFRCHHNKVFMEIYRDLTELELIKNIKSDYYGTYEDYKRNLYKYMGEKHVLKASAGARSTGVKLLCDEKGYYRKPKKMSLTFNFYEFIIDKIKPFLKRKYLNYQHRSINRGKFIIQQYIENLTGDYKVLVYGEKYYVLKRDNRENDFRASGSGKFTYTKKLPNDMLSYAKEIFEYFNVPFISLDIAYNGYKFFLIEFQFLHFGNYTLEKSFFFFENFDNQWVCIEKKSDLEKEFVTSIIRYIENEK